MLSALAVDFILRQIWRTDEVGAFFRLGIQHTLASRFNTTPAIYLVRAGDAWSALCRQSTMTVDAWGRWLMAALVPLTLVSNCWSSLSVPECMALPWLGIPAYGDYQALGWSGSAATAVNEGWLTWSDVLWHMPQGITERPLFASSPMEPPTRESIRYNFRPSSIRARPRDHANVGPGARRVWSLIWKGLPVELRDKLRQMPDHFWPAPDLAIRQRVKAAHLRPLNVDVSRLPFPWHAIRISGLTKEETSTRTVRLSLAPSDPLCPGWLPTDGRQVAETHTWWRQVWRELHSIALPADILSLVYLWLHGRVWRARRYGDTADRMALGPCLLGCEARDDHMHAFLDCPRAQDWWTAALSLLEPLGVLSEDMRVSAEAVASAWRDTGSGRMRPRILAWRAAVIHVWVDERCLVLQAAKKAQEPRKITTDTSTFRRRVTAVLARIIDGILGGNHRSISKALHTTWLRGNTLTYHGPPEA
ncbi:hypothetical protein V8E36_003757 [Tilletia maclaganii]